jgi:hypothetical protein
MENEPARNQAGGVPRIVVLWTRPDHLTREDADAWVQAGTAALDAAPGISNARVGELQSAAAGHPARWHWMLELDVVDEGSVARTLRHGPVADWVRDLRLLGMHPTVMLVDGAAPGAAA